jgi:hypothetical protein
MVFAPEDDRRPQDGGLEVIALGRQDQPLGLALGAQVHAGGCRIRSERADVHQTPHAVAAARLDDPARQLHVNALEVPVQDADQVDDRVGLSDQTF